jgi:hypothetical protein
VRRRLPRPPRTHLGNCAQPDLRVHRRRERHSSAGLTATDIQRARLNRMEATGAEPRGRLAPGKAERVFPPPEDRVVAGGARVRRQPCGTRRRHARREWLPLHPGATTSSSRTGRVNPNARATRLAHVGERSKTQPWAHTCTRARRKSSSVFITR